MKEQLETLGRILMAPNIDEATVIEVGNRITDLYHQNRVLFLCCLGELPPPQREIVEICIMDEDRPRVSLLEQIQSREEGAVPPVFQPAARDLETDEREYQEDLHDEVDPVVTARFTALQQRFPVILLESDREKASLLLIELYLGWRKDPIADFEQLSRLEREVEKMCRVDG